MRAHGTGESLLAAASFFALPGQPGVSEIGNLMRRGRNLVCQYPGARRKDGGVCRGDSAEKEVCCYERRGRPAPAADECDARCLAPQVLRPLVLAVQITHAARAGADPTLQVRFSFTQAPARGRGSKRRSRRTRRALRRSGASSRRRPPPAGLRRPRGGEDATPRPNANATPATAMVAPRTEEPSGLLRRIPIPRRRRTLSSFAPRTTSRARGSR